MLDSLSADDNADDNAACSEVNKVYLSLSQVNLPSHVKSWSADIRFSGIHGNVRTCLRCIHLDNCSKVFSGAVKYKEGRVFGTAQPPKCFPGILRCKTGTDK